MGRLIVGPYSSEPSTRKAPHAWICRARHLHNALRPGDRRPERGRATGGPGTGHGLGLLARLATDRLYLLGFAGQVGGFLFAFLARADLPLYLVQAGSSCAVGLATVVGVLVLGWRVRPVEIAVLVVMAFGLLSAGRRGGAVAAP